MGICLDYFHANVLRESDRPHPLPSTKLPNISSSMKYLAPNYESEHRPRSLALATRKRGGGGGHNSGAWLPSLRGERYLYSILYGV